jgi:hypothetical protein
MTPQQTPNAAALRFSRMSRKARPNTMFEVPCRIRPSNTTGSEVPTAHNSVPMHSTTRMARKTRLRPR